MIVLSKPYNHLIQTSIVMDTSDNYNSCHLTLSTIIHLNIPGIMGDEYWNFQLNLIQHLMIQPQPRQNT